MSIVSHRECKYIVYTALLGCAYCMLKPIDPSFCLSSTWVPFDVQDSLNKARKAESSTQAGLVATYLDIDGYNSHQRNTDSELLYLRAKMHRAKAEVEVYELAIENAFASNSPDSGTHELLFLSLFVC